MQAGPGIRISTRLLVILMLGWLLGFSAFAQGGKNRSKLSAPPANETMMTADGQATVERVESLGPEPKAAPSARQNTPAAAKTAGSGGMKSSVTSTAKSPAPKQDEPITAVVPPQAAALLQREPAPAAAGSLVPDSSGQAIPAETEAAMPVQSTPWIDLSKMIGSVGLIICMILAGYVLFKKFGPQYMAKKPGDRNLRLLETLAMGEKRSLSIVLAGGQKFLLASTPGQITMLTALPAAAGGFSLDEGAVAAPSANSVLTGSFRTMYEQEKKSPGIRPAPLKALPPDIRGKMQELRKALEG
jgi:flagellar biogenesis protein FliO